MNVDFSMTEALIDVTKTFPELGGKLFGLSLRNMNQGGIDDALNHMDFNFLSSDERRDYARQIYDCIRRNQVTDKVSDFSLVPLPNGQAPQFYILVFDAETVKDKLIDTISLHVPDHTHEKLASLMAHLIFYHEAGHAFLLENNAVMGRWKKDLDKEQKEHFDENFCDLFALMMVDKVFGDVSQKEAMRVLKAIRLIKNDLADLSQQKQKIGTGQTGAGDIHHTLLSLSLFENWQELPKKMSDGAMTAHQQALFLGYFAKHGTVYHDDYHRALAESGMIDAFAVLHEEIEKAQGRSISTLQQAFMHFSQFSHRIEESTLKPSAGYESAFMAARLAEKAMIEHAFKAGMFYFGTSFGLAAQLLEKAYGKIINIIEKHEQRCAGGSVRHAQTIVDRIKNMGDNPFL